jgi:hypothetical protein
MFENDGSRNGTIGRYSSNCLPLPSYEDSRDEGLHLFAEYDNNNDKAEKNANATLTQRQCFTTTTTTDCGIHTFRGVNRRPV